MMLYIIIAIGNQKSIFIKLFPLFRKLYLK